MWMQRLSTLFLHYWKKRKKKKKIVKLPEAINQCFTYSSLSGFETLNFWNILCLLTKISSSMILQLEGFFLMEWGRPWCKMLTAKVGSNCLCWDPKGSRNRIVEPCIGCMAMEKRSPAWYPYSPKASTVLWHMPAIPSRVQMSVAGAA